MTRIDALETLADDGKLHGRCGLTTWAVAGLPHLSRLTSHQRGIGRGGLTTDY